MNSFDILIVGGGPAGSTAALFAVRAGLKTLLIDKEVFPRDKICGDLVGGKSVQILEKLDLLKDFEKIPNVPTKGIFFSSPKGDSVTISLTKDQQKNSTKGYVCKRMDLDNLLFQKAKSEVALCLEGFQTVDLMREGNSVKGIRGIPFGEKTPREYKSKITIGADGYLSFVSRRLGIYHYDSAHTMVAIRAYYKGVTELKEFFEIHYVKEALPGYFWIFPLNDGMANVGFGLRHLDIKEKKINLRKRFEKIIHTKYFEHRFKKAQPLSSLRGWNLPVGSIFRPNFGDGVLLVGDAAGLVDPFSGEGMGNAFFSAYLAIQTAKNALENNDVSKNELSKYNQLLKQYLEKELKLGYKLQQILVNYPFLINLIIKKAKNNKKVAEWISDMVEDNNLKNSLANPFTYLKLLWK